MFSVVGAAKSAEQKVKRFNTHMYSFLVITYVTRLNRPAKSSVPHI